MAAALEPKGRSAALQIVVPTSPERWRTTTPGGELAVSGQSLLSAAGQMLLATDRREPDVPDVTDSTVDVGA